MIDKNKIISVIIISCMVVSAGALYFIDPRKYLISIPCMFNYFTGLYCPGCGGLRGTFCLLHFDILKGLKYNLLIVFILAGFIYYLIREIIFLFKNKYISHINKNILYIFLIIFIIYGVIRNLPFEPFKHFFELPS